MEGKITINKCCAVCQYLYDKENCPLYNVYNEAAKCGCYEFDEKPKYVVVCQKFELDIRFNTNIEK